MLRRNGWRLPVYDSIRLTLYSINRENFFRLLGLLQQRELVKPAGHSQIYN
jgi:hypothetical protein